MFPLWLVIVIIFFWRGVWLLTVKTDKTSFTIMIMCKKKKAQLCFLWVPEVLIL